MEESKVIKTKEFKVERMKNGMGDNHLLAITDKAVEDIYIGSVLIIPYAEGFKDPESVLLIVDENGLPIRANGKFGVVFNFIYS